jgi:hypothetical protein
MRSRLRDQHDKNWKLWKYHSPRASSVASKLSRAIRDRPVRANCKGRNAYGVSASATTASYTASMTGNASSTSSECATVGMCTGEVESNPRVEPTGSRFVAARECQWAGGSRAKRSAIVT